MREWNEKTPFFLSGVELNPYNEPEESLCAEIV
jgi:hypothetical protein